MKETAASGKKRSTVEMTTTALMTAILCVSGPLAIMTPLSPVPISLGTLAIYFMAYVLGAKGAVVSCAVYLLLGLVGLPVFSGFAGGLGKVLGPTGGYLVGYLFLAWISGKAAEQFPGRKAKALAGQVIGMVLGTMVCYAFGTLWLSSQMGLGFLEGLSIGVLPYLPGDTAKIILAAAAGPAIRQAVRKNRY